MIRSLSRSVQWADAQELAFASLFKVCQRHAADAIRDLSKYFRQAVKNAMKTLCKRVHREDIVAPDELPEFDACSRFTDSEEARTLRRAMVRLSVEDQLILRLYHFEGRRYAEVASHLHITEQAARQRGYRAEKRLKEIVDAR